MILDPRLVPWSHVVPGVGVALILALAGFFLWRWRTPALLLLTAAPVAGFAVAIWNLQGRLPSVPPGDATLWVFYFAVGGVIIAAAALTLSHHKWWVNVATVLSIAFVAAIWATLFKPMAVPDESGTSMRSPALFLAWFGLLLAIDMRKRPQGLAAEYAPWLTALLTASVCLALTGTASVSTLALVLYLCAIPAALAVLIRTTKQPADRTVVTVAVIDEPLADAQKPTDYQVRPTQLQAITLPLAAALPLLILSGSLYASTPWMTTLLVLIAPVVGLLALRMFAFFLSRRNRTNGNMDVNWKTELLAIAIAVAAAAVPAGIAAYQVLKAAAAEEPYY